MAKKETTETTEKETLENKTVLNLTTGVEAVIDFTRSTARILTKSRTAAGGGSATMAFLLAEITLFDGKKLTGEDILDMSDTDFLLLENAYEEYQRKKLVTTIK